MQNVLIVEDMAVTRQWLVTIVKGAFGACEVHEAANVSEGMIQIRSRNHDIALIDLGLPDGSGLDVLREMHNRQPATTCIVTTVIGDDISIIGALAAGAMGYLLKESPEDVLVRQLKLMSEGVPPLSPSVARRIMSHFRLTGPIASESEATLTGREREVLFLIGRGLSNREVAKILKLSELTIGGYIKDIYRKLGIGSRAEAAWCAARLGLGLD